MTRPIPKFGRKTTKPVYNLAPETERALWAQLEEAMLQNDLAAARKAQDPVAIGRAVRALQRHSTSN